MFFFLLRATKAIFFLLSIIGFSFHSGKAQTTSRSTPNIILLMSDDHSWGQTGYYQHPILRTPNLDSMAKNGLRLDRFYAGSPLCSPTRASVLTARSNDRTGVLGSGFGMRLQEKTIAQALYDCGYKTAHFGKWHLSGLEGPGVPILKNNECNPGVFGFDEWISVTNYFDQDPLMGDNGEVKQFIGSSSDVIVKQAINYITKNKNEPFFIVIWYGSPHKPWDALSEDKAGLPEDLINRNQLGEIVEIDNSIGLLRNELKNMGLSQNTLLWFNGDNGGIPEKGVGRTDGLRGYKRTLYEGGIRVPCVIEWPARIAKEQVSMYPVSTLDIFPTIVSLLGMPKNTMTEPYDGESIEHIFNGDTVPRRKYIPFKLKNNGALIDNYYKLIVEDIRKMKYTLYNLRDDQSETTDILETHPERAKLMIEYYENWLISVQNSFDGKDYEKDILLLDRTPQKWVINPAYQSYVESWLLRPEYQDVEVPFVHKKSFLLVFSILITISFIGVLIFKSGRP